jgi:K+-sensing histidine kinase KdpD
MRKELMLQFLAYRIQEQEFGGLSVRSHRRLRELANSIAANTSTSASPRLAIKPGTRLIRQWKNQVHVVHVEEGNYEYRGARYESLSEIARLITGTRWSGPLFFGLKGKAIQNSKEAA